MKTLLPRTKQEAREERGRYECMLQENAHEDVTAPPTKQEAREERGRHECVQKTMKFGHPPVDPTCCHCGLWIVTFEFSRIFGSDKFLSQSTH